MSKRTQKHSKISIIDLIFLISPFLCGLMPIWSLCLFGVICTGAIAYKVHENEKIILPKGKNIYLILVYLLSFLTTEFFAIDKGMNILAFIKNIPILLFIVLLCQFEETEEEKKKHFYYMSISTSLSVIVSLILIALPESGVYLNSRLHGIFYYANSYGLFLLIGLISLVFKENKKWFDYVMFFTLIVGIILTNSRAIIVLTPIFIILSLFFNKKEWKSILAVLITFILSFTIFYVLPATEKRVNPDMVNSSEFITRIIYYQDALSMIKTNPFGIGYEGFWYEQAKTQTAIYDSKFVHSSILQIALDVGIIPLICLSLVIIFTFFDKKQTAFNRIIMCLIIGHSIIDIDLEFIYFILIISLFLNSETIELKNKNIIYFICSILIIIFSWCGVGDANYQLKNYYATAKFLPIHTDNLQSLLYDTTSYDEQLYFANKILKLNLYVSGAYEALRNEAIENENYLEAIKYEKKRLELNKYKLENYLSYADLLAESYNYFSDKNEIKKVDFCKNEILEIEERIKNVLDNTNPLCYKTIHTPELEIPKELRRLINCF